MPYLHDFEGLHGVTKEQVFVFWTSNLRETMGDKRWLETCNSTGFYLARVLSHFSLQSTDSAEALSPDYSPGEEELRAFADLTQIAEMLMTSLRDAKNPRWMESAGAHILLHAGFFYSQNKRRRDIPFFSEKGRECYMMAAMGKRGKTMELVARRFDEHLFHFTRLHKHLEEKRYLINVEH